MLNELKQYFKGLPIFANMERQLPVIVKAMDFVKMK